MNKALIIIGLAMFALVGCRKSDIARSVEDHVKWIQREDIKGVSEVTHNQNRIVVVANEADYDKVKSRMPQMLNDFQVIVIKKE